MIRDIIYELRRQEEGEYYKLLTVGHTYACPKYSELGSFRIIAYLHVSDSGSGGQRQYSKKKVQRFFI